MSGGYMGRLLNVNLTTNTISEKFIPEDICRNYIGGSGLGARLLFDQTTAETSPFSEDNRLIFLTGPLTGTLIPMAGRHSVITKSALGIWGEGDCGGSWGTMLKKTGYDGIIIEGQAKKPVYLWVCDQGVSIKDAKHLWGLDTVQTDEIVKKETNSKAVVSTIGQAGEKLVKMAVIISDGKHARSSGRGGLGAVMGSKKLKAIAVYGKKQVEVEDYHKLKELIRIFMPRLKAARDAFGRYGTSGAVVKNAQIGQLPIKNWSLAKWDEKSLKNISGQVMAESILEKKYYCKGCVVGCGRVINIPSGDYKGTSGGGPEYETAGSLGSLCLIDDLEAISFANDLCNRYGIDTISAGSSIAFAMEAYEKGIINKKDTGGIELCWGNKNAMISMVKQIGEREGFGRILGKGVKIASEEIGYETKDFAVHVKGLELPMHDPRAVGSLAISFATYPRGACHRGCSYQLERSGIPELGYEEPLERQSDEGKAVMSAVMNDYAGLFNSLKLCQFIITLLKPKEVLECLNLTTGWQMDLDELLLAGERASNVKRMYNVRVGLTKNEDTLPKRILSMKDDEKDTSRYLPDLETLLKEYYQYREWSETGIPLPSKLKSLGLGSEASFVETKYPNLANC